MKFNKKFQPTRKKRLLVGGATLFTIVGLVLVAVFLSPAGGRPITAFTIGDNTNRPEPNNFVTSASLKQGDTMRMQIIYQPRLVTTIKVRIVKPSGEEAFVSSPFTLNDQKEFSLAMNTSVLDPGDYKIHIDDQDGRKILTGDLKIVPADA